MERLNLKDTTFLILIKLDSIDRLLNIQMILRYFEKYYDVNINVLEVGVFNSKLIESICTDAICFNFVQDHDPILYRTMYINQMVSDVKTKYIAVWDCDVLLPPHQVKMTIEALRKGRPFIFPYDKKFYDTGKFIREQYFQTNDFNVLVKNETKMIKLYAPDPAGGAFFAEKDEYIKTGAENTNFYGWGIEDGERITRWKTLGYNVERVPGCIYHLTHERNINSHFHTNYQSKYKLRELGRIASMTKSELQKEIKYSWNHSTK